MEKNILNRLQEIQEVVETILQEKENFTVETINSEGTTYTHDREHYLQLGLEVVYDELEKIIEEVSERLEKKSRFKIIK